MSDGASSLPKIPKEKLLAPLTEDLKDLSDLDLLSLIVSAKQAKKLLEAASTMNRLSRWTLSELIHEGGLSEAAARRLHAALIAGQRSIEWPIHRGDVVDSSFVAYRAMRAKIGADNVESFWVMTMDVKTRVIGIYRVAKGTVTATLVHPREALGYAVRDRATSCIFFHNHPSGVPEPSAEDGILTHRLYEAGQVLGIRVNDHLVVTPQDYYSFADNGKMSR